MNNSSFHHTGFVVPSIRECQSGVCELTGCTAMTESVFDPIQKVTVAFLTYDPPGTAWLELIEPVGEDSPVQALALRGGGLHHLCYEVDDLDKQLAMAKRAHAIVVRPPQPATAFNGRRIAWVMTKFRLQIEYLERAR